MNDKKDKKYIFSQKLAGWLMYKGYVLLEMRPDKYHPNRNVFIFNDSENIAKDIEMFKR